MADEEEVVLISYWASMFGARLKVALSEKQIPYKYIEEDLPYKTQFLLQMNPVFKKIPVLVHNGKPVNESLIALQYIDDVWKDKGASFMPSDPYLRSQARFWAYFIDLKIYHLAARVWRQKGNMEEQELDKKELIHSLKLLEQVLGDDPFFGGKTFGFLDIAFIGYSSWFSTYETYGKFSMESECPKLVSWVDRCMKRESVANSVHRSIDVLKYIRMIMRVYGPNKGIAKVIHTSKI
ncbi:probable glutathione S-transferase [Rutidosis leptorrhynchoides]|uniref:probable glutathione S-transferase n=1 Tax=Rutidosis leptorrhynchoides TaxID=125765 RepID=UPI003A99FFED